MNKFIELMSEKIWTSLILVLGCLGIFASGTTYVYFYNRDLFMNIDIIRLILIIISSVIIVFICQFLIFLCVDIIFSKKLKNDSIENIILLDMSLAFLCTFILFLFCIIIKVVYQHITFTESIYLIILGTMGCLISAIIGAAQERKQEKKKIREDKKKHKIKSNK